MLKVLIIDDEPLIREGLCSIIDWERYGYKIVGTAKNGNDGLKSVKDLQPDVVFIDIKMPGISGIEMVRQAKETGIKAKFIVLSGYSNFTYAQESIRLGMESYLLKPVDEEELIPLIQKIKEKCMNEKSVDSQLGQYEKIKEQQEWRELLHGKIKETLRYNYGGASYLIASLVAEDEFTDWEQIEKKVEHLITCDSKLVMMDNQLIVLYLNQSLENAIASLEKLRGFLRNNYSVVFKIQCIDQSVKFESLSNTYKQLLALQNYSYIFHNNITLYSSMLHSKREKPVLTDQLSTALVRALEFEDNHQLEKCFAKIKKYYQTNLYRKERIRAEWLDFMKTIFIKLKISYPHLTLESNEQLVEIIYQAGDLEKMLQLTKEMLKAKSSRLNCFVSTSENSIDKIIQYTEQYHYRDLSLKVIAELFKYNRSYLGKKFKNCTGDYFHVYLDKVRLEKAKQLLKQPDMKVYQVSEKVGYSNIDYFYKKFRKYNGISPKEYQKEQLNKEITVHL